MDLLCLFLDGAGGCRAIALQCRVEELTRQLAEQENECGVVKEEFARLQNQLSSYNSCSCADHSSTGSSTSRSDDGGASNSNKQASFPSPTTNGATLLNAGICGDRELIRLQGELSLTKAKLKQATTNGQLLQQFIASQGRITPILGANIGTTPPTTIIGKSHSVLFSSHLPFPPLPPAVSPTLPSSVEDGRKEEDDFN